jgi:hypothetical protein
LLFVGLNLPGALNTYREGGEKEDWRGAVAAVTEHAAARDAVFIAPAADAASFAYYTRSILQSDLPMLVYPGEAYRLWLPSPSPDSSRLRRLVRSYERVWLIEDEDASPKDAQARTLERVLANDFTLRRNERFTRIVVMMYERAAHEGR